ncbi:MAG: M3 family oligoendopeptidase [Bacteroidia bacterium]|nr:M3 family oligoendopeptidase [Bacteroidia bacterium]
MNLTPFLELAPRESRRTFLPGTLQLSSWADLEPYYLALRDRALPDLAALEAFIADRSELEAFVSEEMAWRYIRMTCDTANEQASASYLAFLQDIKPQIDLADDELNRKTAGHPAFGSLDSARYLTYTRQLRRQLDLFREENIPLETETQTLAQQYSALNGAMTITHNGETLTLQQAGRLLEEHDRSLRQQVWEQVAARRLQDREAFESIFGQQVALRHQIALNAGYSGYTRYKFDALGRFDYRPEDTAAFHDAVEQVVTPVYSRLMQERRERLGLDRLRPWDMQVELFGQGPLRPFRTAEELLNGSVEILAGLRPELGEMLRIMERMGNLDLGSRIGKAPGGYNYPLMETGVPFIFMNAAGTQNDVTTMLHESGHAVHAFLTRDLALDVQKNPPSEVAELASMSMELLTMEGCRIFYPDDQDLARAQKEQLMRCITVFPSVATVDAFQQWAYDHPGHSPQERADAWTRLYRRFHGSEIDWSGYETAFESSWIRYLHIFEVPFYYIEYAIAQLGALAVWRNFRRQPAEALDAFLQALRLGYTRAIPEIYQAAGIEFNFSAEYMRECVEFCYEAYQAQQTGS